MKQATSMASNEERASVAGSLALQANTFEFTLDTADGLRAVAWTNRLTGRTLELGNGPEVEFDIGLPDQPLVTPRLRVTGAKTGAGEAPASRDGGQLVVVVELADAAGHPVEAIKRDSFRALDASLGGVAVDAERVHRSEYNAASWQAWRIAVPPGAPAQSFAVRLLDNAHSTAERRFSAYFLPDGGSST